MLHLLELETGARPKEVQRIPPGTMDLFVEIGTICRDVDGFLVERGKAISPAVEGATVHAEVRSGRSNCCAPGKGGTPDAKRW